MRFTDDPIHVKVLAGFAQLEGAVVEPLGAGLINRTFRARVSGQSFVLQHVNRIFDPAIHQNILAVTERLAAAGLVTPRLVATRHGLPCLDLGEGGVWRLMTFVEGAGFDVVQNAEQARSAGALVARFHACLDGMEHSFAGLRIGVHDTPRHLRTLAEAVAAHRSHRLAPSVAPLAQAILDASVLLPSLPSLAPRVGHGDLKFNNVLFAAADGKDRSRALCLVDLDTVGPMSLAFELGDAWRSWCNPHGEEREDAIFDLDVFAASLEGYANGLGRHLSDDERRALLLGVEWISLELAARFAGDALNENYFGWDASRFVGRGEHNLLRARSQWALHREVVATRSARAKLLETALSDEPAARF